MNYEQALRVLERGQLRGYKRKRKAKRKMIHIYRGYVAGTRRKQTRVKKITRSRNPSDNAKYRVEMEETIQLGKYASGREAVAKILKESGKSKTVWKLYAKCTEETAAKRIADALAKYTGRKIRVVGPE
jgi:hypothetical protein